MLVEIAETMGLEFRETDSESNYWFDFNGIAILVMSLLKKSKNSCVRWNDEQTN